jgi:hypothetical protein
MKKVSRRDFLKLGGLALGSLAFRPTTDGFPQQAKPDPIGIARVTIKEIDIFKEPDAESEVIGIAKRDQLLPVYEELNLVYPEYANSPRWYRLDNGFAASSYTQRVDGRQLHEPVYWFPEGGQIGEIGVPYTRSYRYTEVFGWQPLYMLYYQSVHWIMDVDEGPDKRPWYKLEDELLHVEYFVPATHMRVVQPEELTPISPEVPWEQKRIEVNLIEQKLTAYEGDQIVLHTLVSTGIPGMNLPGQIPTDTPKGRFNIEVKMPSKHMGDGQLTSDIFAYELPGVPWNSFFHETGVAFHGTYWHQNYGRRMSHGCVNMTPAEAQWLFRWAFPEAEKGVWEQKGFGTTVRVT